ncbi:hypothetical protein BCR42DRAFT_160197 [Absidia repens]|uniref:Tubulin-specific chaperone A n=1 Tax=Absidia repens TaxID=90262 RepID=A0A1X2I077_9FUNG|nr:hypothetical protein BCR42DRAFT_160197 [Absidia repens]
MVGVGDITAVPAYMTTRVQIKQSQIARIGTLEKELDDLNERWDEFAMKIKAEEKKGKNYDQQVLEDYKKRAKLTANKIKTKNEQIKEAKKYRDVIDKELPPAEKAIAGLSLKDATATIDKLISKSNRILAKLK